MFAGANRTRVLKLGGFVQFVFETVNAEQCVLFFVF